LKWGPRSGNWRERSRVARKKHFFTQPGNFEKRRKGRTSKVKRGRTEREKRLSRAKLPNVVITKGRSLLVGRGGKRILNTEGGSIGWGQ